ARSPSGAAVYLHQRGVRSLGAEALTRRCQGRLAAASAALRIAPQLGQRRRPRSHVSRREHLAPGRFADPWQRPPVTCHPRGPPPPPPRGPRRPPPPPSGGERAARRPPPPRSPVPRRRATRGT